MEAKMTIAQFEVLMKLVHIVEQALRYGVAKGEGLSDSDSVEWNVASDKVELTID